MADSREITEYSVDTAKLSPEKQQKIESISNEINPFDSGAVIQFGFSSQSKISSFADSILDQIRAKDADYAGDILTDLMTNIKDLKIKDLSSSGGFVSRIPILGSLVDEAKKFTNRYKKLSTQIDSIVDELTDTKMKLLKDITLFDALFEKNMDYMDELDLFIAAGQMKMQELQNTILPETIKRAEESNDPADSQRVNDTREMISRFEKRLHDLKLSRMISIQTIPQIRLIQNNDQLLAEKIQSSIINTIPLWKNQVIIALGIFRQKKALEIQKNVTETTNELLLKNSEMLKESSIGIAQESEKGIVEIETLKKVNDDLITTIEETLRIHEEGHIKRVEAEKELIVIENDLKQKLRSVKSAGTNTTDTGE